MSTTEFEAKCQQWNPSRKSGVLLGLLPVLLGLSGCTKHKQVQPPNAKLNPSPQVRYEVAVDILGDVGVRSIGGRIQYDIDERVNCVPTDYSRALGGVTPQYSKYVNMNFAENPAGRYVGYVFRDAVLPANYYGLGVCTWHISNITLGVHAGAPQKAYLFGDKLTDVFGRVPVTWYCAKPGYETSPPMDSCESPLMYNRFDDKKRDQYFRINIYSRRLGQ